MAKVNIRDFGSNIGAQYKISSITDVFSAVSWIFQLAKNESITDYSISISDGKSSHDGTLSRVVSKEETLINLVKELENSEFIGISISAVYNNSYFVAGINFENFLISIVSAKGNEANALKLEELLNLV